MTNGPVLLAGFWLAVLAARRAGWSVLALIALLASLILLPKFLTHDPNPTHVGITLSAPAVSTYSLVVVGLAYFLLLRVLYRPRGRSIPVTAFIFLGFLAIGFGTIWHGTDEQIAGALELGLGFCAWFVGGQLGPEILARADRIRWVAATILGLVSIEALVSAMQRAGIRVNPMKPSLAAIMGDRTNGTTNHPDNLGKVMLLLLILALGLLGSADARTRRMLWVAIVLMFVPLGLSQGRANILAAVATIVLWALLSGRKRSLSLRVGLPLVIALVSLPFIGSIEKRVEEDPNGGGRPMLAAAADQQIHREPWGVGPNSYVSVVSAYSYLTSTGYPVHDTFLLTTAELGILGAVLFWLPVAGLVIVAWMSRKRAGFEGSFALAIVASAPGLYIVNATGWGLISYFPLPLWFLICGIAYSQFGASRRLIRARLVGRRGTRSPVASLGVPAAS